MFSSNDCPVAFYFSSAEVLVTLTSDVGRILARLHQVQPSGNINFLTAVRVAHVNIALLLVEGCKVMLQFLKGILIFFRDKMLLY